MSEKHESGATPTHGPDKPVRPGLAVLPEFGYVAAGAGLLGLLLYPLLIASQVARYAIPAVDAVALVLGTMLLWRALRRRGGLDLAIAALATGGLSLYLFLAYVTGPPPAPGGT